MTGAGGGAGDFGQELKKAAGRKVSQITYIAAIVSFALGGLVLLGTLFGLTIGRHPEITHEAIPSAGPKDVKTETA